MSEVDEEAEKERASYLLDLAEMMQTKARRAVMYSILRKSNTDLDVYEQNPYDHARSSGRRFVGTWLTAELKEANYGLYTTMMQENEEHV